MYQQEEEDEGEGGCRRQLLHRVRRPSKILKRGSGGGVASTDLCDRLLFQMAIPA
jgi:hypothetical protein